MTQTVLVPVAILEGETVDPGVIDVLADASVVLAGYHVIPEQTATEQARESFADRANEELDDLEAAFESAGATVERRLVFTHDREESIDRIATEVDADAVVQLGPAMEVDRLLVALHPAALAEPVAAFAADLLADSGHEIVLFGPDDEEADTASVADARDTLTRAGIDPRLITVVEDGADSDVADIAAAAEDSDVVVLGERAPELAELLFGDFEERVARETLGPVFVVLAPDSVDQASDDDRRSETDQSS